MSLNFDQIKAVDDYTKLIISGYIHRISKLQTAAIIPPLINYVIISYFYNPEYFAKHGDEISVNIKQDIAKLENKTDDDNPFVATGGSIFGNIKIPQNTHCKRFMWTFKIWNAANGVVLGIGIDASVNKCLNSLFDSDFELDTKGTFYSYDSYDNGSIDDRQTWIHSHVPATEKAVKSRAYGICFTEQDKETEITMEFDTEYKRLRYYVNEVDQGIAVENVSFDNNEEYTLAISMDDPVCIQLMSFQQMYK